MLKIFNSAFKAEAHIFFHKRKIKGIFAVFKAYAHQLRGFSLLSHRCVERGSKRGQKYHIHSGFCRLSNKGFHNFKISVAENFNAVYIGKAIIMEPRGVKERLLGKICVCNGYFGGFCAYFLAVCCCQKAHCYIVLACGYLCAAFIYGEP